MQPGQEQVVAGYTFRFEQMARVRGSNYVADEARFTVLEGAKVIAQLAPQKRRYLASGSVMTEAAIDAGLFRDLFVAMGEPVGDGGAWAIRLHYKPMIRWIWLGPIFMAAGAFTTVADRRYRRQRAPATQSVPGAGYAT